MDVPDLAENDYLDWPVEVEPVELTCTVEKLPETIIANLKSTCCTRNKVEGMEVVEDAWEGNWLRVGMLLIELDSSLFVVSIGQRVQGNVSTSRTYSKMRALIALIHVLIAYLRYLEYSKSYLM